MNLFSLVWNYLKAKPLNTSLNILLLSLGIAVITILLLFNNQLTEKIEQNARGIDLVVGAKGSPLQLILCNIFHIDFPTGNIKLNEAEKIAKNRLVKSAIPLALGDSHEGFRIVGTNKSYADLYDAQLATGDWWIVEMEVVLGSFVAQKLNLNIGDRFASTHGLTRGGHAHEEQQFVVKGILNPTTSIADNLIFTSVESIWHVHEEHAEEEYHERDSITNPSRLVPSIEANDSTREITSLLVEYRSPMAAIQLPRFVNSQSSLQAASPAFETARLFTILGVGVDVLMALAYVLIFISALSIFIALYNSLKERRYDLAIMRSMGASRKKILTSILLEGITITFLGSLVGLVLGHGILILAASFIMEAQKAGITGLVFYQQEGVILAGSLLLGFVCALIPAWQAYRTDISKVLAGN
ncbi:MAG: ABC transporter permease [Flammeovirgaceae bacterium]|nr:ABC transporter permease [Flammeovirgaceae bacterium]